MIWISYYERHLQYLWSSYFIPFLILQLQYVVKCDDTGECLQIFQCPDLTADLFNLTAPDFAAKYHLRCSRYDSGFQGVCCPMQNPSFNTIIQNEDLERTQVPHTSTKTVTYTEFFTFPKNITKTETFTDISTETVTECSTFPKNITKTETFTDISTETVTEFATKIQTKVATLTFVKENTKTETEMVYETLTDTLTKTVTDLSTKTFTATDTQCDTNEITKTETVHTTDTFTERVPVTHIYVRTSKLRASTVTVTLPPVTTTVQIRSALYIRPMTRSDPSSSLNTMMHRAAITDTIAPDLSPSGLRAKKHSHQQQNYIPDGFIELFGRIVLLPKSGNLQMNWTESNEHCENFDSKPFVPKSAGDWAWLQEVASALDDTMWIPASDLHNEGSIIWTDNTVASESWITWWQSGGGNREADDCMLMWNTDGKVEMVPCSYTEYSAICQF